MKLIVVHNHFRPGGVRRVIELATPPLASGLHPAVDKVVMTSGETPGSDWRRRFSTALQPLPVVWRTDPTLLYLAEQRGRAAELVGRMRRFLDLLLDTDAGSGCVVWAHNQGLGRNLLLSRELQRACNSRGIRLVLHHHDWWFDNRWDRWPEMRRNGFCRLKAVASAIFGVGPAVRHVAINQADAKLLQRQLPGRSVWIPNPAGAQAVVAKSAEIRARRWLRHRLNDRAPVWLMPCRLIRRKNIAEALLLTRWLRPEAWLVTTGGVSSTEENAYAERLHFQARQHGWRLRLAILKRRDIHQPSVSDLMSACEVVLLTSLQEGFGLPYLEAPQAGRPLIARALPNVMPDLARFGFYYPQTYQEILIDPRLFDWAAEVRRQERLYSAWRSRLPRPIRRNVALPLLLQAGCRPAPVPFSRLTLTGQLEVLRAPVERSWRACVVLNPFLPHWRDLASCGSLTVSEWPARATHYLGSAAYVQRFQRAVQSPLLPEGSPADPMATQEAFILQKLSPGNLYPLTWNSNS